MLLRIKLFHLKMGETKTAQLFQLLHLQWFPETQEAAIWHHQELVSSLLEQLLEELHQQPLVWQEMTGAENQMKEVLHLNILGPALQYPCLIVLKEVILEEILLKILRAEQWEEWFQSKMRTLQEEAKTTYLNLELVCFNQELIWRKKTLEASLQILQLKKS